MNTVCSQNNCLLHAFIFAMNWRYKIDIKQKEYEKLLKRPIYMRVIVSKIKYYIEC